MWLAAVCSLINSVAADLAVAQAAGDEAEDLDLARRQPVGQVAAAGAAEPSARTRPSSAGMPIRSASAAASPSSARPRSRSPRPRASRPRPYS